MTTEPRATGAPSGDPTPTPAPTSEPTSTPIPEPEPTPIAPTAKVEVKDGRVVVDGKKFVLESDLIAAKESLKGQMQTQQAAHETAVNTAKLEVSEGQKQIATLNAKITENEEARKTGAVTDEEAARVKQELETTKSSLETANTKSLELRRANLVLQYGVVPDTIKEKNATELDAFEEALKAVSTARGGGVGPYATGGGTGEAAPQTPIERAVKVLEATPVRGTRNPPPTT